MTLVMALKPALAWIWRPCAGRLDVETLELGDGEILGVDGFDNGTGLLELVGGERSPAMIIQKYKT